MSRPGSRSGSRESRPWTSNSRRSKPDKSDDERDDRSDKEDDDNRPNTRGGRKESAQSFNWQDTLRGYKNPTARPETAVKHDWQNSLRMSGNPNKPDSPDRSSRPRSRPTRKISVIIDDSDEDKDGSDNEPDEDDRGRWTGRFDFFLSCLGYAVGLGNVWRFPYLCFKHGGGAFLIPYVIMLFLVGIPCFFLELSLGQYTAMGPATVYSSIAPMFAGLGISNFIASSIVGIYYNMLIGWTIYYMFASLTAKLPWTDCTNDFNTDFCFSINDYKSCKEFREKSSNDSAANEVVYHRGSCISTEDGIRRIRENITGFYKCRYSSYVNEDPNDACSKKIKVNTFDGVYVNEKECVHPSRANEVHELFDIPHAIRKTAAQEYFEIKVLNESPTMDEVGAPQWKLVLCLLAAWIIVYICLIRGVRSSGKVVYFTATFPYIILIILFFRAILLPGAKEGIKFYLIPEWERLRDIKVWEGAAVQIFFSLGVGGGGLMTLGSYNKFKNNIIRDTLLVSFGNCLTSFFAGFAIFSVLGFLATEMGVEVKDVMKGGTGLAFIAYPDLVTRLPISPLWSFLFFAMLFTLGLDSQFAFIETLVTCIIDWFPKLRKWKWRALVLAIICLVGFLLGLPLTTRAGSYFVELLDYYGAGWPFLFIALMELLIVSYVYTFRRYTVDLEDMLGFEPGLWFKSHMAVLYMTISPLVILIILIYSWAKYEPLKRGEYVFPDWANALGWVLAMSAILVVPLVAVIKGCHRICFKYKNADSGKERLKRSWKSLRRHTRDWRKNARQARRRRSSDSNRSSRSRSNSGRRSRSPSARRSRSNSGGRH